MGIKENSKAHISNGCNRNGYNSVRFVFYLEYRKIICRYSFFLLILGIMYMDGMVVLYEIVFSLNSNCLDGTSRRLTRRLPSRVLFPLFH